MIFTSHNLAARYKHHTITFDSPSGAQTSIAKSIPWIVRQFINAPNYWIVTPKRTQFTATRFESGSFHGEEKTTTRSWSTFLLQSSVVFPIFQALGFLFFKIVGCHYRFCIDTPQNLSNSITAEEDEVLVLRSAENGSNITAIALPRETAENSLANQQTLPPANTPLPLASDESTSRQEAEGSSRSNLGLREDDSIALSQSEPGLQLAQERTAEGSNLDRMAQQKKDLQEASSPRRTLPTYRLETISREAVQSALSSKEVNDLEYLATTLSGKIRAAEEELSKMQRSGSKRQAVKELREALEKIRIEYGSTLGMLRKKEQQLAEEEKHRPRV